MRKLTQLVKTMDEELRKSQEELKFFKLELINRETNFNKVFSRNPTVGVLTPTAGPMPSLSDSRDGRYSGTTPLSGPSPSASLSSGTGTPASGFGATQSSSGGAPKPASMVLAAPPSARSLSGAGSSVMSQGATSSKGPMFSSSGATPKSGGGSGGSSNHPSASQSTAEAPFPLGPSVAEWNSDELDSLIGSQSARDREQEGPVAGRDFSRLSVGTSGSASNSASRPPSGSAALVPKTGTPQRAGSGGSLVASTDTTALPRRPSSGSLAAGKGAVVR